jgi:uncharacterized protein YcsI (UPF0317 family)
MGTIKLSRAEMAALSPKDYRSMARRGEWQGAPIPEYCCEGYSQHAVVVLPKDYAYEFLLFCTRNPRGLFVSDVCEPGSPHPMLLAPEADVRTDCSKYRVYENGEVINEPTDIMKYWRDDLVTFLLPCSFGFQGVLRKCNVKFRYMGVFTTNLRAIPAGRFTCDNILVSLRLFKTNRDAIRAIQITSRLPVSHGSPICIGDPAHIGIKDIYHPDIDSLPPGFEHAPQEPNEVAMCWVCACTPENAIKAAKPPLAMVHYPGRHFVSDHLTEEFAYTEEIASNLV